MVKSTFITAFVLMFLGVAGYLASDSHSPTALIPAYLGIVLFAFAILGLAEKRRALAMHLAAIAALIGCVGAAMRLPKSAATLSGTPEMEIMPLAFIMQVMMTLVCFLYLFLAIRSFIKARRWKRSSEERY